MVRPAGGVNPSPVGLRGVGRGVAGPPRFLGFTRWDLGGCAEPRTPGAGDFSALPRPALPFPHRGGQRRPGGCAAVASPGARLSFPSAPFLPAGLGVEGLSAGTG